LPGGLRIVETGVIEVALPGDLAAQLAQTGLGVGLDEEAETGFDGGTLSGGSAAAHGLFHQMIVEFDVSAHDV